jgi:hypothetical protein
MYRWVNKWLTARMKQRASCNWLLSAKRLSEAKRLNISIQTPTIDDAASAAQIACDKTGWLCVIRPEWGEKIVLSTALTSVRKNYRKHNDSARICQFLVLLSWSGVRLSPLGTSATIWLILLALDDRSWWWMCSSRWNEN